MTGLIAGKRFLVTGGAGFVGSNLVRRLVKEGGAVTILDDLFTGSINNLSDLASDYEFVEGSVTDADLVKELVSNTDIIFHLAARNIIASTKNPLDDFKTNIGGTLNILLAAREYPIERIVYSSSVSIYGNPRYLPISEDDRVSLLTPYAVSKFGGEGYCQAFYESYGVSVAVVRYSNVYGPGQSPTNPYSGVVAKFMERIYYGETPQIHGDGQQTRDFTYIDDAVEATLLAGISLKADGEMFNVGSGVETSVYQLAKNIFQVSGFDKEPVYIDRRDIDNIRRRVVNIEKTRRMLRWIPQTTLNEGLKRTWEWFKKHME